MPDLPRKKVGIVSCSGEELPEGTERERLLSAVTQAMKIQSPHGCLGCEPCTPGDVLADFYRTQQAMETVSACACEDG